MLESRVRPLAEQLGITIGQAIRDLELLATVYEPADMNRLIGEVIDVFRLAMSASVAAPSRATAGSPRP